MDLRTALARRIDTVLKREIGEGVDVARLLKSPLYARDVLLACDSQRSSELSQLAREFREASVGREAHESKPPAAAPRLPMSQALLDWSNESTGFGVSRPLPLPEPEAPRRLRFSTGACGWFARSAGRWLGR